MQARRRRSFAAAAVLLASLGGCSLIEPGSPTAPANASDAEGLTSAAVAHLNELSDVSAQAEVTELGGVTSATVVVDARQLTEDRLQEIADIARTGLAQADTGFRTELEVYSSGELVFSASGLKQTDDYLRDDIHYLFAVTDAAGVPFRLRSLELYPEAAAIRTIEAIATEYDPALNWTQVALVPDPSRNEWSVWSGPGMSVVGKIPPSYIWLLEDLAAIAPLSVDQWGETGTLRLFVDDGGARFLSVSGDDVQEFDGDIPFEKTAAWPVVIDALRVVAMRHTINLMYGGGAVAHIGHCESILDVDSQAEGVNDDFVSALASSGVTLPPGSGPGECTADE